MKILVVFFSLIIFAQSALVSPNIVVPSGYTLLRKSGQSSLYKIEISSTQNSYQDAPYLLDLHGSRHQIGYDFAALLNDEVTQLYTTFMQSMFPQVWFLFYIVYSLPQPQDQYLINTFIDYCWNR